ncbi:flagellar biosynthesis protein FlhA [Moellerella wisconsensis]|uniref:Flagellar biosynthesis protein FlhA n=1 Tax=Moellerella wisconsensis TaxID=158849 RepID=A0A9Q8V532_9GAMM|nr:flagellar biosynthesis protein FlhA [Moellerella wisconsensis]UNH31817.1 flagellar biosynthesis protein FlhA [Moellerella wisconsensis]
MVNQTSRWSLPGAISKKRWQILAGPVLILLILSMMILPLPPILLDFFFTFNIALSIMVLLVAMFTKSTLEFAAFPTILLFSTLLRLSLNIASTRIILMDGHTGGGAAGKVVEAFASFLVGGNFAIGIIVFIILIVINFMVITKGAGRIAEVGARFVLDGMPGKQMAIDADLNAGVIDEHEAKTRRKEVTQESDFYGSMDGASKFVRGDALAGLLIMAINIIGGLVIGMAQHDMAAGDAASAYTLLTIGDGLVAQIPALIISTAAGVIVTRVATDQDVGEQMVSQLFDNPKVLMLTAGVLGMLGLVPGMPNTIFLLFTAVLGFLGWRLFKRGQQSSQTDDFEQPTLESAYKPTEASWDDVQPEDPLALEIGFRLISLVDQAQGGELLNRIGGIRKKFAKEMGFLPSVVHISDSMSLSPEGYRILIKGAEVGRGLSYPGKWMAINPGGAEAELEGIATEEPAFGLPAVWIDEAQKEEAQVFGYTVVAASTVIATHFNHLLNLHASELFSRQEAQQLFEQISKTLPKLTQDFMPDIISLTLFHKVLQNLLNEQIPIRDMRTIIDTLSEYAPEQKDVNELTAIVRVALNRAITQKYFSDSKELQLIGLGQGIENMLMQAFQSGSSIEPGLAETLEQQALAAMQQQQLAGLPTVLVVNHPLRSLLSRFLRRTFPQLTVLSSLELVNDRRVQVTAQIGN